MSVLPTSGLHVNILAGSTLTRPLREDLLTSLQKLEVKQTSASRSVFSMSFAVGRSRLQDMLDYPGFGTQQLRANSRIIVTIAFGFVPKVLIDGFITQVRFGPGAKSGRAELEVTGQDISLMLERVERPRVFPQSDDKAIVEQILSRHGLIPKIPARPPSSPPSVVEHIPASATNDLEHLERLAQKHGFVFYVIPGPLPRANRGYWGPPIRAKVQPALTFGMGDATNVKELEFTQDSEASTFNEALVEDFATCQRLPVIAPVSFRPPLSTRPLWAGSPVHRRHRKARAHGASAVEMMARVQAALDASTDEAVTARGSLDAGRYGHILSPRGLVGLRGVGYTHDGLYYVKEVTHTITQQSYEQAFVLTREGTGSLTPVVRV